ncbi:MAG: periplasmic sensor signal transduction histidine kinase [Labilithrix sp.]|nr:periplasmic sensor signal transduction histidine kinase [Labilithrix sp.]
MNEKKVFGRFRFRVLAHGIVILLLMSTATLIADRLFVNKWVGKELLERRARAANHLSLYGAEGALVASNVQPPVPAPPPDMWAALSTQSGAARRETMSRDDIVMSAIYQDDVFRGVVVRRLAPPLEPYPGPPLPLILLTLAVCMAATLLVAIPFARSVVRPVEALARSVRRFGTGELATRAAPAAFAQDEIGDLAVAFDEMASRIESLVRSEKRLLANVSHELRTPLARIRVVLELASDSDSDGARIRSYLSEIAVDLAELEGLVDEVLATARLDAAKGRVGHADLPMRWTIASLGPLVDKSRARFASLYPEHELDVVIGGTDGAELPDLRCDPSLLRRVIDNLLDNAAKHAKGSPHVALEVSADDDEVRIVVTDGGPGMAPEVAARAFDAFYRADESRDRRNGGAGLGLSIVRSIVEAHGGKVELDSSRERGTSVTARFPRNASG